MSGSLIYSDSPVGGSISHFLNNFNFTRQLTDFKDSVDTVVTKGWKIYVKIREKGERQNKTAPRYKFAHENG